MRSAEPSPGRPPRTRGRSPTARRARALGSRTPAAARAIGLAIASALLSALAGCRGCASSPSPDAGADAGVAALEDGAAPGDAGPDAEAAELGDAGDAAVEETRACPPEMVRVARRYCVDRWEATLVDAASGRPLSPYYAPSRKIAAFQAKSWDSERLVMGDDAAHEVPLPPLPLWEQQHDFQPRAVAAKGVVPQGYTSGELAALACKNAGKRLCSLDEWRTACRGERDRQFPYGDEYQRGTCNVYREGHPGAVLHNNVTIGHTDPRLNLVSVKGKALLRKTGETPSCTSEWEGDGIADMVGNVDEWIDDPEGTFVGGFFSRTTKDGCSSIIHAHPFEYFDYSTGVRCCADLR